MHLRFAAPSMGLQTCGFVWVRFGSCSSAFGGTEREMLEKELLKVRSLGIQPSQATSSDVGTDKMPSCEDDDLGEEPCILTVPRIVVLDRTP